MNIAWVSHRDYTWTHGGAEQADLEVLAKRPDGVKITQIKPGGVGGDLDEFDRVVVTGFYGYSARELNIIARYRPLLKAHDVQMSGHWLYEEASHVICLSPDHVDYEINKNPLLTKDKFVVNPGTLGDLDKIRFVEEEDKFKDLAVWAARPVPSKGLDNAAAWAEEHNIYLTVLVSRPHDEVLDYMADAEYFVLLPHEFDPYPRTVREAQLSGCRVVINDQVGIMDVDREELLRITLNSADDFWKLVMA